MVRKPARFIVFATLALAFSTKAIAAPSMEEINKADPLAGDSKAAMIRLQVLLDRVAASPGVIDGLMGKNLRMAIEAYENMQGMPVDGQVDEKMWSALSADAKPAVREYTLTEADISQKLIEETPEDYEKMAALDCLCFHRVSEAIAEQFHMDEDLLKELNPEADFTKAGTKLIVADAQNHKRTEIARIEVKKKAQQVLGYDPEDKLVFVAPATVGSEETPSPSGETTVEAVAVDPKYTLNAKKNLNGESDKTYSIAPGPNGPVGTMWIDLAKPTFGIHGTPNPAEVGRASSHGCVRLTNWDATELGNIVQRGATVTFIE